LTTIGRTAALKKTNGYQAWEQEWGAERGLCGGWNSRTDTWHQRVKGCMSYKNKLHVRSEIHSPLGASIVMS